MKSKWTWAISFCIIAAGFAISSGPAQASGDYGCTAQWRLANSDVNGCSNGVMLSPANDTRTNLLLLLADRRGVKGAIPKIPNYNPADPYTYFDEYGSNTRSPLVRWGALANRFGAMDSETGSDAQMTNSCNSNGAGAKAFLAAVQSAKGLNSSERAALTDARSKLAADCDLGKSETDPLAALEPAMQSPAAKSLFAYLRGATRFYAGDMASADAFFGTAASAEQSWVKEAATYMLARVAIMQVRDAAMGDYGYFDSKKSLDAALVTRAQSRLSAYQSGYAKGTYHSSAQGLQRRLYWLAQNKEKLTQEYVALLASRTAPGAPQSDLDLIEELDTKLLGALDLGKASDPILLATVDLAMIRNQGYAPNWDDTNGRKLTRAQLDAQKPLFASAPDLYAYLHASFAFYVDNDPAAVLKIIPDAARESTYSYVQFSRQMLRGLALDAVKDPNAGGFWAELAASVTNPVQRDLLDLAIAMQAERSGKLDRVIGPKSIVKNPRVRQKTLIYNAAAPMLRSAAQDMSAEQVERDIALFTLLYKQVTRGKYADFVKDLALVPAGGTVKEENYWLGEQDFPTAIFLQTASHKDFPCPSVKEIATRLSASPKSANALLCLADFMRIKGFDESPIDTVQNKDHLGGGPSQFAGGAFSRLDLYRGVIADPKASANDKAYALYRAVRCYAPAGSNDCRGTQASPAQRKAWFLQLKRQYPNSIWAKSSDVYW
jgi:hypothetical protein